MSLNRFALIYVLLAVTAAVGASTPSSLFEVGSHCVAYKVKKTTFFVSSGEVVGKNCDVSAQVLPEVGGLYHIEVNVPIRGFTSGESDRDKDVAKILKSEERPDLTFKSKAMSADQWRELFNKSNFELDGELSVGVKDYPIKISMRYIDKSEEAEVDGTGRIRFQDLNLKPPTVGGGIFVKTKSEIELHFHLQSRRILGADSIRLKKESK